MATAKNVALLIFCVAGIYSAYLTQGVVSEHFALKRYGEEKERFTHLESLNGAQSLCCFIWAWLILQFMFMTGSIKPEQTASWHAYWKAGLTNSMGPAFGMIALKNITYSAQVLVKSCKMVPVMVMGTVLYGKRYSMVEYICMSLIGVGVALFGRKSSSKVSSRLANPNTVLGYSLCLLNLAFDGYTNAVQDEINKKHPRNPPIHMMAWMNFWTSVYYALYLFIITNTGFEMIAFCARHPDAAWDVILFCLCGAFGQLFIFFTIKTFGSLVNTLVCTTRKFFNILISVVWNSNPLLPMQWTAVFMVFTGLIASSLVKTKKHKQH
mmetsp:Transcript_101/g.175  ORF Transcript_101/g.175 Transcript_101/m.175 type:complete len:324 (-) Transcript_101:552-1523(-)|eukprot:CAMPEP_0202890728 /NCGR_PEP_ID=MMETSP1392-20130828/1036_1 /ASSEMBLY_ACC=CAM_ASM_000868 /TAXON_ID=225041 /ORGANISM="Chlamydomonas chlamydogama, Strain SAG 11-48b" /LENGTH=323 /DNA_ID=CAMNT_0049574349 /DNA_START=149 /DNA_END=1120 /DNA_ORIENTATION=+